MEGTRHGSSWLLAVVVAAALFAGNERLGWAMYAWAFQVHGSAVFLGLSMPWASAMLAAIGATLVAAGTVVGFRPWRRPAAQVALAAACFVMGGIRGCRSGGQDRMRAVERVTRKAAPFVAAIRAFERDRGRPPVALHELVPGHLPAIPSTGFGGYPDWIYEVPAEGYGNNPWVLRINTGGPGFNFDQMMYFPDGHYPERGYGGSIERVGDWAYVHE